MSTRLKRAASVTLLVLLAALWPRGAQAQPVSFTLANDVAEGQKPTLTVTALARVLELSLQLTRDDGEKVSRAQPRLDRGKSTVFSVGEGKPGKAHYKGTLSLTVPGEGPWSYDLDFETLVRAPMYLTYDAAHLDLAGRLLRFQSSRPAARAEVEVTDEDGGAIGAGRAEYQKEAPGAWLPISWTVAGGSAARPMKIKLHVVGVDGLTATAELIPWSVAIEHEDVTFDSDSAAIKPGEAGKLDASLAKIKAAASKAERFVKVKLYVAGHTDTVGSKDENRRLSLDRARAIAEYFRKKGLTQPIAFEGFGEEVLKVQTPDGTDEQRNRRADYVLGAAGAPPPFGGGYQAAHAEWKALK